LKLFAFAVITDMLCT